MLNEFQTKFQKNILTISNTGLHTREVFEDNITCMAISLSNAFDKVNFAKREEEYLRIVKKYKKEHIALFCENLGLITEGLENQITDFLGQVYESLEVSNKNAGQFFTPFHLAEAMGLMSFVDNNAKLEDIANSDKIYSISDPTCGAGSLLIAIPKIIGDLPEEVNKGKLQKNLLFFGQDIDSLCVKMAYVQMSLLGYAAVLNHGDSLACKVYESWYSPACFVTDTLIRFKIQEKEKKEQAIKEELITILNSDIYLKMGA